MKCGNQSWISIATFLDVWGRIFIVGGVVLFFTTAQTIGKFDEVDLYVTYMSWGVISALLAMVTLYMYHLVKRILMKVMEITFLYLPSVNLDNQFAVLGVVFINLIIYTNMS